MDRMKLAVAGAAALALLAGQASMAADSVISSRKAPASEVMMLPKYCWGQYLGYKGSQFHIPKRTCGVFMNHYCQALIYKNRAEMSIHPHKKRSNLGRARHILRGNLKQMKKHPNCPLRSAVQTNLRSVEMQLQTLQ
ncbi:MAG TPA: hypothetical protein VKA14_01025 [Gammaproteobacteria bacterium]|nr:hypothetical protein [Gammaproteobacteria bacterium]